MAELNPILAREIRARFRDRRSFLLVFALTALICVAAGWIYQDTLYWNEVRAGSVYASGMGLPVQKSSQIGRELFRFLVMGNAVAWLIVAPALTATGLARERERGLLESLWLSPFRVRSQIGGRYLASLLFLSLLQLAITPVYGLAMLMGGVSPGEVALCGLIIAVIAIFGAALGLWCSARAYRPMSALGSALGLIVVWSLAAFFGPMLFGALFFFLNWRWVADALQILAIPHPLLLLWTALDAAGGWTPISSLLPGWQPDSIYAFGIGVLLLLTLTLLAGATRVASKPLPDSAWIGRHPYLERWKRRLDERKKARETRREAAKMSERVGGALLYEVPFERLARFRDPLLQREVRGRFRLRQSGIAVALLRLLALTVVVVVWLFMLAVLFDAESRSSAGQALVWLLWFLGALTVAVLSSSSLTRERESGTWEGLHLSLLSPGQIVRSKWLSPLVTFAYWSAPLWIWLPLGINWHGGLGRSAGVSPGAMLGAISLVMTSLCAISALGIFISSRCAHSAAATSWTLFGLLAVFILMPIAVEGTRAKNWVVTQVLEVPYPNYTYTSSNDYDNGTRDWQRANTIADTYYMPATLSNVLSEGAYRPVDAPTRRLIWLLSFAPTTLATLLLLLGAKRKLHKS